MVRTSAEFAKTNDLERVVEIVRDEREEAARFTGFPAQDPLSVVILPSRTELMAVSCVNEWAGGFYDGTIKLVEGPNHALPRVELRHELVHAVALSRLPSDKPLWFTEGVADNFSTPKKLHGQKEKLMATEPHDDPHRLTGGHAADHEQRRRRAGLRRERRPGGPDDRRARPGRGARGAAQARGPTDPTKLAEATLGHPISSEAFFQLLEKRMGSSTTPR